MPDFVVWRQAQNRFSDVLKLSNNNNTPVIPVSSQVHYNGGAVPREGGIVMDLSQK